MLKAELFHLADEVGQLLEAVAERYSDLIIAKLAQPVTIATPEEDYHRVNINHIEAAQARSIGVETLACHAVRQLQLDQKLTALGFNKIDSAAALGSIIGRMVSPGSELQTHDWLQSRTGLGELLDHDYGSTSLTRLYTISDRVFKHQPALEAFLTAQEQTLFDLNRSIVMYDLTNTYFGFPLKPGHLTISEGYELRDLGFFEQVEALPFVQATRKTTPGIRFRISDSLPLSHLHV